jgi:GNAT superfamily N-acetyltransferase
VPTVRVVRTYLEMTSPDQLRPALIDKPALQLVAVPRDDIATFRRLYRDVGGPYHWRDRNAVPDGELRTHFESPDVELWMLEHATEPAGFFELKHHPDRSVEIVYFGLVRRVFGHGFGKHLLTCAVQAAWALGAERVWLHTCTLDSPAALPNYLARGFDPVRTETYDADIPERPAPAA